MGYSNYSTVLTILTCRTPLIVITPTLINADWNKIDLSWPALTTHEDTGRTPITYYKLEYNDGVNGWVEITSSASPTVTSFNHTLAVPFPANIDRTPYIVKYRVTGYNTVGVGITSMELSVVTDTYPTVIVDAPILTFRDPLKITMNWTALTTSSADTGDSPILFYKL